MSNVTANGTTSIDAQAYAETELPSIKADALLGDAERIIKSIATLGDDSEEYKQAAFSAELRVFEFLATRPDTIKSEQVDTTIQISYFEPGGDGFELVRQTLDAWTPAKELGSDNSVAYVSSTPW